MNDYAELVGMLNALRADLKQCEIGAWHDRCDSISDSTRHNYEGQSDGFKRAGERLDKVVAKTSFEAKPGQLAMSSREIVSGVMAVHAELYRHQACAFNDVNNPRREGMMDGLQIGIELIEDLIENIRVGRP